jgi:hypothetical protein
MNFIGETSNIYLPYQFVFVFEHGKQHKQESKPQEVGSSATGT